MAQVHGLINRQKYYWRHTGWVTEKDAAEELTIPEAHSRLRIINANNRFLDIDEQVDAEVVESR
jgi:hypothetical protein